MNDAALNTKRRVFWLGLLGPFIGLFLVIAIFSGLTWWKGTLDDFLTVDKFRMMSVHATVVSAAGLGMTVIMIMGGIDLSVGYVVSLITVMMMLVFHTVVGRLSIEPANAVAWAVAAAVLAGLATGTFCGWCNGMFTTHLKVAPFVATLAMMGFARGLGIFMTDGGRIGYPSNIDTPVFMRALGTINPSSLSPSLGWMLVPPSVWSVLILAVIVALVLRYTVLGRHCFAIGSNEATARLCGVRVERTKVILYSLAGLLVGWAGVIQLCRTNAGSHDVAGGMELSVIAAVVIGGGSLTGGQGTVLGTLIGALIITILENGCTALDLKTDVRYFFIAAIILGVAALNSWRQKTS